MYPAVPDNTENTYPQAASTKSCLRVTEKEVNQGTLNHKHERKRMEGKKDYQRSKRLTNFSLRTAWMVL
jgi:hypothetical protein